MRARRWIKRIAAGLAALALAIGLFLATIVASALLALVPPLLFRAILDDAIPSDDRGRVTFLAALTVLAALGDALLQVGQRWWSSRIGEGLIYDLRTALFDHVQRMPVAFSIALAMAPSGGTMCVSPTPRTPYGCLGLATSTSTVSIMGTSEATGMR